MSCISRRNLKLWPLLVAVVFAVPQLGCGADFRKGQSIVSTAETQMANFGQAIDNYRLDNKKLPASLQELTEAGAHNPYPYISKIPVDPWGNEYIYRALTGTSYEIRSYGEDKLADTDDDVVWPRSQ